MGFKDKVKQGTDIARTKVDEARKANAEAVRLGKEARAAREAGVTGADGGEERLSERRQRFEALQAICPLPITFDKIVLPGGLALLDDEFLVVVGKDWGWSSKQLTLTTHRAIYSHGRASKHQGAVYLTDIRDVKFHKPLVGYSTLTLETAGANSIEGLPAAKNGAQIRNKLLELVHFARTQAEGHARAPHPNPPQNVPPQDEDIVTKLKQLEELKTHGLITPEEYESKRADLLNRL